MEQTITLYFKEGPSDKVYQASMEQSDTGYIVHFAFGRRGTALQTGTKTQQPVAYEEATRIFDKLVAEKTAKGYRPGITGGAYQAPSQSTAIARILPMLLNAVDEAEAHRLIESPCWLMQQKHDGRRLLIKKQDGKISGFNKKGLPAGMPLQLVNQLEMCPLDFTLDGEIIGEHFHAFDLLSIEEVEVGGCRYTERLLRLMNLLASFHHANVHLVQTAHNREQKLKLFNKLKKGNWEGVVFKDANAPYLIGRPASGGYALKFKFQESASFIVSGINDKRSVSLSLRRGMQRVSAGNVTIPANQPMPKVDAIVEVRYLYAFPESGHIFQPVYLGERDDVNAVECTVKQLKFKPIAVAC